MKRDRLFAIIGLFLLTVGSAIAQDIRYNFDKSTDFSKFKTYKWVVLKDATKLNDLADKSIRQAIDIQLAGKGLARVDSDDADLYIGYQGSVGQEKEFTSFNSSWGYGPGWYGGGWYGGGPSFGTTTGQTSTIYVGQLAIDMYDSTNRDLVWRGLVSKTLDPKAKPEKQEKNINKAMTKLFKKYPPQKKA